MGAGKYIAYCIGMFGFILGISTFLAGFTASEDQHPDFTALAFGGLMIVTGVGTMAAMLCDEE